MVQILFYKLDMDILQLRAYSCLPAAASLAAFFSSAFKCCCL